MHLYLNEHQRMAVEALETLKSICDRYNITFYLLAGTTLGAVRHQGMIPWDDDIDVGLKYNDWHRLRKILPSELDKKFQYIDNDVDDNFPRLFGKILYNRQSCIDLFLIAKWTDNLLSGWIHWQIRRIAVEFYKYSLHYKTVIKPTLTTKDRVRYYIIHIVRRIGYCIARIFWRKRDFVKLARWNECYYEKKETEYYINLYSIYSMKKEMIRAEWINNASLIEYEGKQYMTVGNTDAYLKHLYGDYMTPPSEKKQIALHQEKF